MIWRVFFRFVLAKLRAANRVGLCFRYGLADQFPFSEFSGSQECNACVDFGPVVVSKGCCTTFDTSLVAENYPFDLGDFVSKLHIASYVCLPALTYPIPNSGTA